jgi:hypothetical protein
VYNRLLEDVAAHRFTNAVGGISEPDPAAVVELVQDLKDQEEAQEAAAEIGVAVSAIAVVCAGAAVATAAGAAAGASAVGGVTGASRGVEVGLGGSTIVSALFALQKLASVSSMGSMKEKMPIVAELAAQFGWANLMFAPAVNYSTTVDVHSHKNSTSAGVGVPSRTLWTVDEASYHSYSSAHSSARSYSSIYSFSFAEAVARLLPWGRVSKGAKGVDTLRAIASRQLQKWVVANSSSSRSSSSSSSSRSSGGDDSSSNNGGSGIRSRGLATKHFGRSSYNTAAKSSGVCAAAAEVRAAAMTTDRPLPSKQQLMAIEDAAQVEKFEYNLGLSTLLVVVVLVVHWAVWRLVSVPYTNWVYEHIHKFASANPQLHDPRLYHNHRLVTHGPLKQNVLHGQAWSLHPLVLGGHSSARVSNGWRTEYFYRLGRLVTKNLDVNPFPRLELILLGLLYQAGNILILFYLPACSDPATTPNHTLYQVAKARVFSPRQAWVGVLQWV